MRAIPKKMLIHTVTLAKAGSDRWGTERITSEQELKHVRMEPSSKIVRDKNNAEIQLAAELFYDCKNSRPTGISFEVDDLILFNGQKYAVRFVEPLYDDKRLHHYEVGLVKHA